MYENFRSACPTSTNFDVLHTPQPSRQSNSKLWHLMIKPVNRKNGTWILFLISVFTFSIFSLIHVFVWSTKSEISRSLVDKVVNRRIQIPPNCLWTLIIMPSRKIFILLLGKVRWITKPYNSNKIFFFFFLQNNWNHA